MAATANPDPIPPGRLSDLTIRAMGDGSEYVVKNPHNRKYLKIGQVEAFLLDRLDGRTTCGAISSAFQAKFGEPLSAEDIDQFVELARKQGLIAVGPAGEASAAPSSGWLARLRDGWRHIRKQNPLFFRVRLIDPDRMLSWLEPRTRFLWTAPFASLVGVAVVWAAILVWLNRADLVSGFDIRLGWQTIALAWITVIGITFCHEFAHGIACKRYGGEVREIGVLIMLLTPFFYCNVSDAWLLPSKRHRLLISFAGIYIDLIIWALAVFAWRTTLPHTLTNHLAWVVLSACGARTFFNLNPLLKLDGYYLLSDWLELPNLRGQSLDRVMAYVRWLLWGAAWPAPVANERILLVYGVSAWLFTVLFLQMVFFGLVSWIGGFLGWAGMLVAGYVFLNLQRRLFQGLGAGEVRAMILKRHWRTLAWVAVLAGAFWVPLPDRTSGTFEVRPVKRVELRAPVTGFLHEVEVDQGDQVSRGALVAHLEIPDLVSQIARKKAEISESEAILHRLEAGPRPEEVVEQRERVKRAERWRDIAVTDLARSRESLTEELERIALRIAQSQSELDYRDALYVQAEILHKQGGIAGMQLADERKRKSIAESELKQMEAAKRSREAEGVLVFEGELARREKELADTKAALKLLEAGSRPEDIDAERAHRARLLEELRSLEVQREKAHVMTPLAGLVTTPRLKEKAGQYLEKGALICVIEDLSSLEVEISVSEQDASRIEVGNGVALKPRSQPYRTLTARVDRIAPAAVNAQGAAQSTLTVYCRLENGDGSLVSGMTGFGRIQHRVRPVGLIAFDRAQRYLRTEFWW